MKSVIYSIISTKVKSFRLGEKFIKKKNDRRDVKQNVLKGCEKILFGELHPAEVGNISTDSGRP